MNKPKKSRALAFIAILGLGWAWHQHMNRAIIEGDTLARDDSNGATRATGLKNDSTQKFMDSQSPQGNDSSGATSSDTNADGKDTPETALLTKLNNARALIDAGSLEEGAKQLEELIKEDPTNTSAMMELAMLYTLDFKDLNRAKGVLEHLLDVAPDHRAALAELDLIYRESGTVEEGLETLQAKSQQHPQSKELQYAYGRLLSQIDPNAALPWLKRGTEIADVKEDALNDLANAALRAGQIALAIESWTDSLRLTEAALEQARINGEPGTDYLEERIASTKSEIHKARNQISRQ